MSNGKGNALASLSELSAYSFISCATYRCHSSATGLPYAVKKIPQPSLKGYEHLVQNEISAYQVTGACDIPRVVRLKDTFVSVDNEACLVVE